MDKEEVQGLRVRMEVYDEAGELQDSRGFWVDLKTVEPGHRVVMAQGSTVWRMEAV